MSKSMCGAWQSISSKFLHPHYQLLPNLLKYHQMLWFCIKEIENMALYIIVAVTFNSLNSTLSPLFVVQ